MPVEESTDIDLGTDEKTFDELDRAAAKAIKTLEKRNKEIKKSMSTASKAEREQKRLEKRGGIFAEEEKTLPTVIGAPKDISKKGKSLSEIIEEQVSKTVEKQSKKITDSVKEQIFGKDSGTSTIKNIISMGKNPVAFATNLFKAIPFIGGVIAFADFAKIIIDEVVKLDAFFKAFVDKIDDRVNQLRDKVQEANIRAGNTQLITTTEAGGTEPRESYNTFTEFNDNQMRLEVDFAVRDTSGV